MSVQQLWDALQKDGAVVSNSPKNRARLYKRLQESGISYKTEVIGYTTDSGRTMGTNWGDRRDIRWDLGRVAKWISTKRILAEDILHFYERYDWKKDNFPWEPVEKAFTDPDMPSHERYAIIKAAWGESLYNDKFSPFDHVPLRKTVVRITFNK